MGASFNARRRVWLAAAATLAVAFVATAATSALAPAGERDRSGDRKHLKSAARVAIRNFTYRPRALRVRRGTRVVFANRDSARHTATRRGSFDTGIIRSGRSAAVRFRRRGVYRYLCTLHPFMRGKVVVR